MDNVPIVHLQLAIGQLLVAHGSYNGVLRSGGFLVGDGIRFPCRSRRRDCRRRDCGGYLRLRCGGFGNGRLRDSSFGGVLSALHTADDQRRQCGDQDDHGSNSGDDLPGGGLGASGISAGVSSVASSAAGCSVVSAVSSSMGASVSRSFRRQFLPRRWFLRRLPLRALPFRFSISGGIVFPAVGADSASFCQFFLTKLTFSMKCPLSPFRVSVYTGNHTRLVYHAHARNASRTQNIYKSPRGRMRQISFSATGTCKKAEKMI